MERAQYITTRRARFKALGGRVNIPWGAQLEAVGGVLTWNGLPVCASTSQSAHDFFARNDDGKGLERGRLSAAIVRRLSKRDHDYQKRWDRVWEDRLCQKYRRRDHIDHWLWNHEFFEADLGDLRYIAGLVGVPEEVWL